MGQDCKFNTRLLHGNTSKGYGQREILPPISQVSAFRYESMEELEKVFAHKSMGYAYTRIGNPSVAAFEQKINELEGGAGAICCSSGMSAITSGKQDGAEGRTGDHIGGGTIMRGIIQDGSRLSSQGVPRSGGFLVIQEMPPTVFEGAIHII